VVVSLFASLEENDADTAAADFATEGFIAYEEPPLRIGTDARDRDLLDEYLKQRVEDGSRLALVDLYFNGGGSDRFRFNIEARNENDDPIYGVGAISCANEKVVRLVLSVPDPYSGA
jgi:hypothetical protein